MIIKNCIKQNIAFLFSIFLLCFFVRSGTYGKIDSLAECVSTQDGLNDYSYSTTMYKTLESEYSSGLWHATDFIDLHGRIANLLNIQGLYSDIGMYLTDDMYIVSASPYTTTDYEFEELVSLHDFLTENGVNLLYVNAPTKYMNDNMFREQFGIDSFSNENMDVFLSRIKEAGINSIDLREYIMEEQLNIRDLFYRTDHHWTTKTALWAAEKIAEGLNEYCGYDIDLSIYDEENYTFIDREECWLGEQGRKMGATYVGLDNYTEIKPTFHTEYFFNTQKGQVEGDFNNFIDESTYEADRDVYNGPSWHYSYLLTSCINKMVPNGKLLLLGDSYSSPMEPFLSLGVHAIDPIILREADPNIQLRDQILKNGYDTVVICYAQFMLGAHDDQRSSNAGMYYFNR